MIATLAPHITRFPSLTHWAADMAVLLKPHPSPISISALLDKVEIVHRLLSPT
jgi:hypothetical protein